MFMIYVHIRFTHMFYSLTFATNTLRYSYITASTRENLSLVLSRLLLLDDAQLDSLALGERDHRLSTLADHEHVRQTSGELVTTRVSHVNDIERTEVTVTTHNHTHTTRVVTLRDETQVAHLELHMTNHLVRLQIHLHRVVHLHVRIGVTDRTSVVSHNERNLLSRHLALHHLAQLVLHITSTNPLLT